jgi:aminoglycoside phosphotransferase family enzyme
LHSNPPDSNGDSPVKSGCLDSSAFQEEKNVVDPALMSFLLDPLSYGQPGSSLKLIESHMSYVFLIGDRAYKMKKPMKLDLLDNLALAQRQKNCLKELTLNRVMSPDIYLNVTPVTVDPDGAFRIGGSGEAIEWLVVMRRLNEERLLDHAIPAKTVTAQQISDLAETLGDFYRQTQIVEMDKGEAIANIRSLLDRNEQSLRNPDFGLLPTFVEPILTTVRGLLNDNQDLIIDRVEQGWIRDCHGDLRPEHVHLGPPVRLIDRLEFNDRLRWHDPFEEIADLGLECERLGAAWIYPLLVDELTGRLGIGISKRLLDFYAGLHGCVRARLAIEHLRYQPELAEYRRGQTVDCLNLVAKFACRQL